MTLPALERGLGNLGRGHGADIEVTCPGFIAVAEDDDAVREGPRRHAAALGYYASTPAYRPVLELHGWGDLQTELYECSKTGRWEDMARPRRRRDARHAHDHRRPPELAGEVGTRYGGLADRITVSWWRKEWWPGRREGLRAL